MRTTLPIDDDVLLAAKHLAKPGQRTKDAVISALAKQSLAANRQPAAPQRKGVPLLPMNKGTQPVNIELVNQLRDA